MDETRFIVTDELSGCRVDAYIAAVLNDISRSRAAKLIDEGNVSINSAVIKKTSIKVNAGDVIDVVLPQPEVLDVIPEDIPLDILYEDSDVIVVNKPKGMVVHPDNTHRTGTLVNGLLFHCKDLSGVNGVMRPGIVHRIDMNTTGSVIACKNDNAHNSIAAQLKEHSVNRRYVAIVEGVIKNDEGTIDAPIGRNEKDRKLMAINHRNGKRAITHYRVIERLKSHTYIECRLETGRTHQIRVHMKSIGHPIVGDEVYGKPFKKHETNGQCLHAKILGFVHPSTNEYIETVAPIPEYFERVLEILR